MADFFLYIGEFTGVFQKVMLLLCVLWSKFVEEKWSLLMKVADVLVTVHYL